MKTLKSLLVLVMFLFWIPGTVFQYQRFSKTSTADCGRPTASFNSYQATAYSAFVQQQEVIDISGKWSSNIPNFVYEITQTGRTFEWWVGFIGQKGSGKIEGRTLHATWATLGIPDSARGRITEVDQSGRAIRIEWSNDVIFTRPETSPGTRPEEKNWIFQGRVFQGNVGDETHPVQGAVINLFGANNSYPPLGSLIRGTTTNTRGWYGFEISGRQSIYEFYVIRLDSQEYKDVEATSVGGTVKDRNVIEYVIPLERKTLTGNKFWIKLHETDVTPSRPERPEIREVSPGEGECGTEMTLTISGENFKPEVRVSIREGVEIIRTQRNSSRQLVARIRIHPEAFPGQRKVEVVNPDGQKSEAAFEIFCPSPPEPLPDLEVEEVEWDVDVESSLLVIKARVANKGEIVVMGVEVKAAAYDWIGFTIVPEIGPGDEVTANIKLEIQDEFWGRPHNFEVLADPEDMIPEPNNDNNSGEIEVQLPQKPEQPESPLPTQPEQPTTPTSPPTRQPEPPSAPPSPQQPEPSDSTQPTGPLPPAVWIVLIIIFVIGGITFSISFRIRGLRRLKWQEKAKEEKPPVECQPCTWYCRKVELEAGLKLYKISHLGISASDPESGEPYKERQDKGRLIDFLNKVVESQRQGEDLNKFKEKLSPLVKELLQQIVDWLSSEPKSRDVSITGHLEGSEITFQFILYHCKRKGGGNVWGVVDKWKKKIKDEREKPVGVLRDFNPDAPELVDNLTPKLTHLLMQFIEKV